MSNKIVSFLLALTIFLIAPGCWDIKDVNNSAFVITIGIDKPLNPLTAKYLVTLELARPNLGQANPGDESLIVSAEADSILQAMQRLQSNISRNISLSHLRVVVIGEDIAREKNFKDITNYLIREPKVALRLRLVFVQNGTARDLFYAKPKFEKLLGAEIVDLGQSQQDLSLVLTNNFLNFISDLRRTGGTALGSRVAIQGRERAIVRDGATVYKNWSLDTWLNAEEAQAANWLIKKSQPLVLARDGDNTYTYQISNWSRKITPVYSNGIIGFQVKINTAGMVMEEDGSDLDFSKTENLRKMESLFTMAIKQQVQSAINKSQIEVKSDYLGFSKAFQQYHPETFKTLDWSEVYPAVPIEVQVTCKVKGYGFLS